jgi:hypothetical protein
MTTESQNITPKINIRDTIIKFIGTDIVHKNFFFIIKKDNCSMEGFFNYLVEVVTKLNKSSFYRFLFIEHYYIII